MNLAVRYLLLPVGFLYRVIIWLRNFCYERNIFRSQKLPCKVVSIGNISLGGTGKTPAVISLTNHFQKQNISVAVLSRGYGRKTKNTVLVSDGKKTLSDWLLVGDEALLLANNLKSVPIVVDENRVRGGQFIVNKFNPDIIILDDGFQHRKIQRDVDIVLLNCLDSSKDYRLIPLGKLREPLTQLKRADVILWSKSNLEHAQKISIQPFTNASVFESSLHIKSHVWSRNKTKMPLQYLRGKSCVLVSGVGSPESVIKTAKDTGVDIRVHLQFKDHHNYSPEDLSRIQNSMKDTTSDFVLTTEKDRVKLMPIISSNSKVHFECELISLPVEFKFSSESLKKIESCLY